MLQFIRNYKKDGKWLKAQVRCYILNKRPFYNLFCIYHRSIFKCFPPLSTVCLFPRNTSMFVRFLLFSDLGISQVND